MKTAPIDRSALAVRVWEAAICDPTDHLGDAQAAWLQLAEDAARCLGEQVRKDPESQAAVAGTLDAIRRAVMIGRILGEAMHHQALAVERQARESI